MRQVCEPGGSVGSVVRNTVFEFASKLAVHPNQDMQPFDTQDPDFLTGSSSANSAVNRLILARGSGISRTLRA